MFWIAISATAALVAIALALSFRRGRPEVAGEADMALYRDQLAEVERDAARGVLSEDEAERIRVEVSRRLLAADRAAQAAEAQARGPMAPALLIGALVAGISILGYQRLGQPGLEDLSLKTRIAASEAIRANRPHQEEAERLYGTPWEAPDDVDPAYLELIEKLRTAVFAHPDDLQGWRLLTENEARLGNFSAAARAQGQVVALLGDKATAEDNAQLASLMVQAAGGFVSPETEAVLVKALQLNPKNGLTRYYTGLMFAQVQRFDLAMKVWVPLVAESGPEQPWTEPLRSQIGEVAALAGVRYTLPPLEDAATKGPSAADVAAAAGMSAEDRQAMIRGMVDGLASELAEQGGPPEKWAQLLTALGVLGDTERAQAIWDEAQETFADDADGLAKIRTAAISAGVAE
ncbi:c-type cytochrome biogenesis protein CcmI [Frigidibacter sp. ROC022]|uniref:c-type cytochrome biogenesis protein CcmI n=1 Tax=Frigidibacter sp. ROC022 TaxID=2971796 RepID=UPI00215B73FA|nr:c-type cytochrome biogenesis protein CcmI [Frigidibacter sp. ROC022]MCR8725674.1 c-type cytochrome biogenesis protein CcmI [Frigidibacter sp. ROC022]